MVTASVDKSIKVWDALEPSATPTMVAAKQMAVGQLFSAQFDYATPFLLAVGGSKGVVALWELNEDRAIAERFAGRDALAAQLRLAKPAISLDAPPAAPVDKCAEKAAPAVPPPPPPVGARAPERAPAPKKTTKKKKK